MNTAIQFSQKISDTSRIGKARGGVLVSTEQLTNPPDTYNLRVDTDGDGDLANNLPVLLVPNTSTDVRVLRRWGNEKRELPYTIGYSREPDQNNQIRERISWATRYRAEGKLKFGKCEALFVAMDLNGDGLFDQQDFSQGTSIGLDRNNDRRIWGEEEWLRGNQIIEYCGTAFLISAIAANGSSLTLVETSLRVPKLGAALPEFSVETITGQTISLRQLKGKMHLLDFWASWCKPCVEKFSLVKQLDVEYGKELEILAVNVDEEARLTMAREIIKNYGLRWPHVMSGKGEADPLWKTFGGMEDNRLSIPLYVLVDAKGFLRYAGNGGENLSELRHKIEAAKKTN
jgi:thiol-disulfide isomerase/thioredoxin